MRLWAWGRFSLFVTVPFLAAALPSSARAEAASSRPALDPAQLDAFAGLVGEPASSVAQRLSTDPSLVPLAATAAEARLRRRHSGKVLTITGFTILGVGTTIGLYMIQLGGRPVSCGTGGTNGGCDAGTNPALAGLVIAAVSQAVGLALAIPGMVKMARESETETDASARYHSVAALSRSRTSSPCPTQSPHAGVPESKMLPTRFLLPLLSGTF